MDPLFPELPENLSELTDEELAALLKEHEVAAEILEDPAHENYVEFTKGLSADELAESLEKGVEQIETIVALQKERKDEIKRFEEKVGTLAERRKAALAAEEEPAPDEPEPDEPKPDDEPEAEVAELADEEEAEETEEAEVELPVAEEDADEMQAAAALAASAPSARPALRRPPAPSAERRPQEVGAVMVATAGQVGVRGGSVLDRTALANAIKKVAQSVGPPSKHDAGIEQRFLVASANFPFPEDRMLHPGDPDANARKIQKVVPMGIPGVMGLPPGHATLVASGGLCAPLEPIYSMPNFASLARPVRDALPSFQADRGGVNVPTATYIGDITTAISLITEADDATGGTFGTKSCQDLTCPSYTEVAVTTIAHCREYGNLNARAWPEKIAHENDLTMAAHARTAERYLLERIKALSIGLDVAQVIGAYADLVRAFLRARANMVNVLRMSNDITIRVLMPEWVADELAADTASTQFDRFEAQAAMLAHLRAYGFAVSLYKDGPSGTGDVNQMFSAAAAGNLAAFPTGAQIAFFPEGTFIHVDPSSREPGGHVHPRRLGLPGARARP